MVIEVRHTHYFMSGDPPAPESDPVVVALLRQVLTQGESTMATIAEIQAAVAQQQTVIESAVTLLTELGDMLEEAMAANDPTAMQSVLDQIRGSTQTLATAVTANTPVENEPAPAPAPGGTDTAAGGTDTTAGGADTAAGGADTTPGA